MSTHHPDFINAKVAHLAEERLTKMYDDYDSSTPNPDIAAIVEAFWDVIDLIALPLPDLLNIRWRAAVDFYREGLAHYDKAHAETVLNAGDWNFHDGIPCRCEPYDDEPDHPIYWREEDWGHFPYDYRTFWRD